MAMSMEIMMPAMNNEVCEVSHSFIQFVYEKKVTRAVRLA
jgi:hypothetical protein